MLHLLHVKQMYSFTNELILCIQITRRRLDINGDPAAKSLWWHQVLNLQPSTPDLLHFAPVPSLHAHSESLVMSFFKYLQAHKCL